MSFLLSCDIKADTGTAAFGTHGRVLLQNLEVDRLCRWKAVEKGRANAACHVFEETGRDGHLLADEFEDISVGNGGGEVVGGHGVGDVGSDAEVEYKKSPHDALLGEHTVVGEKS